MIQHTINGSRVDTLYTHLSADGIKVKVGDTVKAGDFIALSGNTGCSQAAHLHFGIYNGGFPRNAVDPTTILGTSG
ncbi:Glycyl-glycine endopeptidase ALE-1 precursor [compost metagenome]